MTTAGHSLPTAGVSVGRFFSMFGFEVDYWNTTGEPTPTRHSIGGVGASFIVQSNPWPHGVQTYGLAGFGVYGETFGGSGSGEASERHLGGGAKIGIAGPLKLRLDYRVFLVGDTPDAARGFVVHRHPQRLTAGLGLAF